ncbi:MAG: V-type ATP synthase subunit D [Candidatus Humimicrobiaceae bacterium]|jgi:V/A-type H+-transporting ATPase subunit D|nr:V-type ATP synthase subunit D [Actinomycetota bacterium]MDD5600676.1 V-type ATP synthase subunit D [Actinomycetota bacterium]MDY0027523.1 V-type ATP synthase subunit D [Candidatus Humimicrobiaceae bacterium]
MLLDVNPTRMELTRLRTRLALARRGHKLLKDKRDELMRQWLGIIEEVRELRFSIEKEFQSIVERFILARASAGSRQTEQELLMSSKNVSVSVSKRNIMSVYVPEYTMEISGDIIPYGYINTSGEMDIALKSFEKFLENLLKLAEKEKMLQLLAMEIEETRRRVNALEYKLIPDIIETIKFITMKLDENERSNMVRLMRVKEIVKNR